MAQASPPFFELHDPSLEEHVVIVVVVFKHHITDSDRCVAEPSFLSLTALLLLTRANSSDD